MMKASVAAAIFGLIDVGDRSFCPAFNSVVSKQSTANE